MRFQFIKDHPLVPRRQKFLVFRLRKQNPERSSNEELLPLDFITKENATRRGGEAIRFSPTGLLRFPNPFLGLFFFRHAPSATIDELAISNATIRNGQEMQKAIKKSMVGSVEPLQKFSPFFFSPFIGLRYRRV